MGDFEHELISIDDNWRKGTTDAVAAQLRDAGIKVKRTILPGSTFWNDWANIRSHQPTGTCALWVFRFWVWLTGLVRPGMKRPSIMKSSLTSGQGKRIANADERRVVMERIEQIMQEEGGHPAILAFTGTTTLARTGWRRYAPDI